MDQASILPHPDGFQADGFASRELRSQFRCFTLKMRGDDKVQADSIDDVCRSVAKDPGEFFVDALYVIFVIHQHDAFGAIVEEIVEMHPLAGFLQLSSCAQPACTARAQQEKNEVGN